MGDRSSCECDSDDSIVANSVESDRTPSPSILGGIELLDRTTKRSTPTDFNSEKLVKRCCQETADGEMHQTESPGDKSSISKDVGLLPFPLFEPIQHGYHHSPVFTPPKKSLTQSLIGLQDKDSSAPTALLSAALGTAEGLDEVYSQALFSSNQSSCQSPGISFGTTGSLSLAGEDTRDQLVLLTDKIIHSLKQTQGEEDKTQSGGKREAKHSGFPQSESFGGGHSSGELAKSTKMVPTERDDENHVSSSTSPGRGCVENAPSNNGIALPTVSCLDRIKVDQLKEIAKGGPIQAKDACTETGKAFGSNSELTELTATKDLQAVPKTSLSGAPVAGCQAPSPDELFNREEGGASQEKQIKLGSNGGNESVIAQPCDMQSCPSRSDESNNEFDHILKEYQDVEVGLTQSDSVMLSTLQEKLSGLKEAMKMKAQSLKEERRKILDHHSVTPTSVSERKKEEELFDLSMKQKQILSLLTFHKELASRLSFKMQLEEDTSTKDGPIRSVEGGSSAPFGKRNSIRERHGAREKKSTSNNADEQSTYVLSTGRSIDDENVENLQPNLFKPLGVESMTQLTLKDLLGERVMVPGKGCLEIPGQDEVRKADLLPDGSILSGNVWYKTEREWYAQHSKQKAKAAQNSDIWNLITYNGDLLSNLACQCQVLSMARAINKTQTVTSVPEIANLDKTEAYPTAHSRKKQVSQRRPFYDSVDLSSIKFIHLIGDDELIPQEEVFNDDFWRDEVSESVVPSSWLNDLTRWED